MVEIAHSPTAARPDALIWTKADQDAALMLGWGMFYDSAVGFHIAKAPGDPRFKSSADACTAVLILAGLEGRQRHLYDKALRVLEFRNPAEFERITRLWEQGRGLPLAA